MKCFALCIVLVLACNAAAAADTVALGRLVKNEPMEYVPDTCPENSICLHSWWKWVIDVDKTVSGPRTSGHIVAARMQHASLLPANRKRFRLFVLRPIEDSKQRALLRADYYLEDFSWANTMYCLDRDPKEFGLSTEETYVAGVGDSKQHCFELPPNGK